MDRAKFRQLMITVKFLPFEIHGKFYMSREVSHNGSTFFRTVVPEPANTLFLPTARVQGILSEEYNAQKAIDT